MLVCKYCFRNFEPMHLWHLIHTPLLCRSCYQHLEWHHRIETWQGIPIESLFDYGPVFQKMIYQFKSNFDVELGGVFLNQHQTYLKLKYFNYTLIFAPTHHDDYMRRGFHPLVEIFKDVGLPSLVLFEKNRPYHQSEQQGINRQGIQQVVILKQTSHIPQQICLVDDVMTTGETLKAMISLLKPFSIKRVKIFVLARKKPEKFEITRQSKNDKINNWKQQIWHG